MHATATAKSLQLCPTLCHPIDGSPPGSPIPGILQARTLEWVAISSSNAWKWKVKVKSLSHVWRVVTPWTAAHQAPPSMGFSRQEYWSGCHRLFQGNPLQQSRDPELQWKHLELVRSQMWAHTLPLLVPVPSSDTLVASSWRGWGHLPGSWGCAAHWAPGSQHQPWEGRNHTPQENKNGKATSLLPYDSLGKSDSPYLNLAFFTTKPEKSLHFSFLFKKFQGMKIKKKIEKHHFN